MPSTLESLNIEINANAGKASEGIGRLVGSLRSLSQAAGTALAPLRSLNSEISKLSGAKVGNLSKLINPPTSASNNLKKVANATKEVAKATLQMERAQKREVPAGLPKLRVYNPETGQYEVPKKQEPAPVRAYDPNNDPLALYNQIKKLEPKFKMSSLGDAIADPQREVQALRDHLAALKEPAQQAQESLANVGNAVRESTPNISEATDALKDVDTELKQKHKDGEEARRGFDSAAEGEENVGENADRATRRMSRFGAGLTGIGRIARSLIIRTALRGMMKAFGEAWTSAYNFSKGMRGDFAAAVDTARAALSSIAITGVQTFAPAIQALVPIISAVASAIAYLCSVIQWLLSLLGATSSLVGATTSQISKAKGGGGGGGGGKKGMLASWDELNVIQSSGGGGGGGGGGSLSDMVTSEIDAITSVLVGEALMALGLIMCATGHFGIGLGLIAVGAAGVAQVLVANWGSLSDAVKREVATITTIAGSAFLALGLILAFTGHPGVGIPLILMGVANIAGTMAVAWGEEVSSGVKQTVATIAGIAGGAMLALGAILAFSGANVPLGIGLMMAGAGSLGGAATLAWGTLSNEVQQQIHDITAVVSVALLGVGAILAITGANVPVGLGMLAAGALALGYSGLMSWSLTGDVVSALTEVGVIASGLSLGLGLILALSGANIPLGIGLIAAGAVGLGAAIAVNWDAIVALVTSAIAAIADWFVQKWEAIKQIATDVWDAVSKWWTENIAEPFTKAWNDVVTFFTGLWTDITTLATEAWTAVSTWWTENVSENIGKIWNAVSSFFEGLWNGITSFVSETWSNVSKWWTENVITKISTRWQTVKTFLTGVWNGITTAATSTWNKAKEFWETSGLGEAVRKAWNGVKEAFDAILSPVKTLLDGIWSTIQSIFGGGDRTVNLTVNTTENRIVRGTFEGSGKDGDTGGGAMIGGFAAGAYNIPKGDLFIANEAGAELVGSMAGKTTVANQQQIIEGIQRGVSDANAEQNALLRQQNEILTRILAKETNFNFGASAGFGRTVQRSLDMYGELVGG